MGSVLEKVQLVKDESARIGEYFKTLSPEAWAIQSACDAWQVSDVVAHLTGAVDRFGPNIVRGLAGDDSAPEGMPPAGVGDMAARLRANAQVAIDFKESLGGDILVAYNDSRVRFDAVFAEVKEADKDKLCYHAAGTISIETYLNLRITELIIHEWDIRSSLEAAPEMSAESLPAIIEMFPVFVVGRLFDPGAKMAAAARFRFELTGSVPGSYDIVAGGGQKAIMELRHRCRWRPEGDYGVGQRQTPGRHIRMRHTDVRPTGLRPSQSRKSDSRWPDRRFRRHQPDRQFRELGCLGETRRCSRSS